LSFSLPKCDTMERFAGRVTVYSVVGCPHCNSAKAFLKGLGLPYCEVDVEKDSTVRQKVKELTGRSTVPQIFFNKTHIGGNDDLQNLVSNNGFFSPQIKKKKKNKPSDLMIPSIPCFTDVKGERDNFAELILEFKSSGIIKSHGSFLKVHKLTFSGSELIEWLVDKKGFEKDQALNTGKELMQKKFFSDVSGKGDFQDGHTLYRLIEHDCLTALNSGKTAECSPVLAAELSEALRRLILKLYGEHLSPDGKTVDYKAMENSQTFQEYCELATQLQRLELKSMTREEKLAFFINVYNALVIHGHIKMGPPKNLWQRYKFFNGVSYLIGGEVFTLQDIENGVLRGNRKGVGQLTKPFSQGDQRLQVALPEAEPLIHFALNCGAKGCPAIRSYSAKTVDAQLKTAGEAFLEGDDGCHVNSCKNEIRLSQIFKWYKVDFGDTNEKLLQWVAEHMADSPKKKELKELLGKGNHKVVFLPYDWSSNSKD
uniref:Zgc:152951 n=1 Tax=Latimeria chalumnae TaxID=7897 RepID=H3AL83_LATCH